MQQLSRPMHRHSTLMRLKTYSVLSCKTSFGRIHRDDRLIIMGDFNVRVSRDADVWEGVLGRHSVGQCNGKGLRLLTLCSEYKLTITNTRFKLKQVHQTT